MIELRKTAEFDRWLKDLRDLEARSRIHRRLKRLEEGYFGDHKRLGEHLFELRIHCGPGYRVYCFQSGWTLVVVLAGGDKTSQDKDIRQALRKARDL